MIALSLAATACGSSKSSDATSDANASGAVTSTSLSAENAKFCAKEAEMNAQFSADSTKVDIAGLLEDLAALAPKPMKADFATLVEAYQAQSELTDGQTLDEATAKRADEAGQRLESAIGELCRGARPCRSPNPGRR